jgi:hypothetical protein
LILGALTFSLSFLAALTSFGFSPALAARPSGEHGRKASVTARDHLGLWVTADGQVRQELLPDGRFVETGWDGQRMAAGFYQLEANHIEYRDDRGLVAAGDFRDGMLYQSGMVLYRRDS